MNAELDSILDEFNLEDVNEGTALLAVGGSAEDVIWAWYVNFQSHWGRHALGALQALHDMLR